MATVPTEPTDLITADELAAHLRVRPNTVKDWARKGWIPELRPSPGVRRFRLADVLKVIEERGKPPRK